jgi:hypothetical protein
VGGTLGVARVDAGIGRRGAFADRLLRDHFSEFLALGNGVLFLMARPSGAARASGIGHGIFSLTSNGANDAASHVPLHPQSGDGEIKATPAR